MADRYFLTQKREIYVRQPEDHFFPVKNTDFACRGKLNHAKTALNRKNQNRCAILDLTETCTDGRLRYARRPVANWGFFGQNTDA